MEKLWEPSSLFVSSNSLLLWCSGMWVHLVSKADSNFDMAACLAANFLGAGTCNRHLHKQAMLLLRRNTSASNTYGLISWNNKRMRVHDTSSITVFFKTMEYVCMCHDNWQSVCVASSHIQVDLGANHYQDIHNQLMSWWQDNVFKKSSAQILS